MLMYGTSYMARQIKSQQDVFIYNLTSMAEEFCTLPSLIPPNNLPRSTERDFDIAYAQYIFSVEQAFIEFFCIIYNLYIGIDVFLVVDQDQEWTENILESLLKLIQQRYGYVAVMVLDDNDYIWTKNNGVGNFAPGFGLYNLDQDKERFTTDIENMRKTSPLPPGILWGDYDERCY